MSPSSRRSPRKIRIDLEIDGQVWHRVASLAQSGPEDSHYVLTTRADGSTTLTFGDGRHGKRLPHGDRVQTTFRPSQRFTAVLQQQGPVILDSDWSSSQPAARLFGVYSAVVVDNADPQSRKRLRVTVPAVLGAQELWAKSCLPVGAAAVPAAGAQVWVAFEAGDPASPVWLGTLWS